MLITEEEEEGGRRRRSLPDHMCAAACPSYSGVGRFKNFWLISMKLLQHVTKCGVYVTKTKTESTIVVNPLLYNYLYLVTSFFY